MVCKCYSLLLRHPSSHLLIVAAEETAQPRGAGEGITMRARTKGLM